MRTFWAKRAKVPLLDQYNDAIKQSTDVITVLNMLTAGWGILGMLEVFGL